jgi:DNA primase
MRLDYAKHVGGINRAASKLAELCAQNKHDQVKALAALIQQHAVELEIWAMEQKGDS